ncbi:MAG: hypothetical protein ACLUVD_10325 [Mediterraneibacter faecis]
MRPRKRLEAAADHKGNSAEQFVGDGAKVSATERLMGSCRRSDTQTVSSEAGRVHASVSLTATRTCTRVEPYEGIVSTDV